MTDDQELPAGGKLSFDLMALAVAAGTNSCLVITAMRSHGPALR